MECSASGHLDQHGICEPSAEGEPVDSTYRFDDAEISGSSTRSEGHNMTVLNVDTHPLFSMPYRTCQCGSNRNTLDEQDLDMLHSLSDENALLSKKCAKLEKEAALLRSSLSSIRAQNRTDLGNSEHMECMLIGEAKLKEDQLRQQLSRLEGDLRAEKSEGKSLRQEMDRINQEYERLDSANHSALQQLKKTKEELKELKMRDLRLEEENGSLEEENVALQSLISKLKCSTFEQDSMQQENESLKEQVAELNSQLDEISHMKLNLQKEVEELYESLKEERQLKYQLKTELANYIQQVQLSAKISRIDFDASSKTRDGTTEISQINSICNEMNDMGPADSDLSHSATSPLSLAAEGLLDTFGSSHHQMCQQNQIGDDIQSHNLRIRKLLNQANLEFASNGRLQPFTGGVDPFGLMEQQQLLELLEIRIEEMISSQRELRTVSAQLKDLTISQNTTADTLSKPFRLLMTIVEEINQLRIDSSDSESDFTEYESMSKADAIAMLVERLALQARHMCDTLSQRSFAAAQCNDKHSSNEDLSDSTAGRMAIENVQRYKNLLAQKRAKIATMRLIIKSDRRAAQFAIANLKTKFENEKLVVTETIRALRFEQKTMKEAAMQYARQRALHAARGDEYAEQVDRLQRALRVSMEEKTMLRSLLRMSVQQKVSMTEKMVVSTTLPNNERQSTQTKTTIEKK